MSEDLKEKLRERFFRFVAVPLTAMPLWIEAIGAGVFISEVVDRHPRFKDRLGELDGKAFLFEAADIKKRFYLHVKDREIKVIPHFHCEPDVVMRGDVEVLASLFLGRVDPDTVFFSRRLEITGDTAAAILLKNLLAGL
ncbi:MAG: SCP2 sterol-binding domain-containing protein [Deltaproteobacteria bacterium]|nr:SCP2 sterol-binding domain-containing protein [Deltaproteobacteria bacterium]